MANHQSAAKRARHSEKVRLHNKYYGRTTRNMIKKLREQQTRKKQLKCYPKLLRCLTN